MLGPQPDGLQVFTPAGGRAHPGLVGGPGAAAWIVRRGIYRGVAGADQPRYRRRLRYGRRYEQSHAGRAVLEVAQFTFVPAAGAILADWGADVIKVEHPVRGDTQRGFINMGGFQLDPNRHPLIEHPNRGKRSVGIDVSTPGGQEVLYEIAKTADVFLTNTCPPNGRRTSSTSNTFARRTGHHLRPRQRLRDKGPERDTGGFDGTAFWTRSASDTP